MYQNIETHTKTKKIMSTNIITHPAGFTTCNATESLNDRQWNAIFSTFDVDSIQHIGMKLHSKFAKVVMKDGKIATVEFSMIGIKAVTTQE